MKVVIEPEIQTHDPDLYQSARVADKIDGFGAVNDSALRQYADDGYLVVAGGLDADEVTAAKDVLHRMTLAADPGCSDVYYEGVIREHLPGARRSHEAVDGDLHFNALALGDIGERLPDLPAEVRARYVRKFAGFCSTQPVLGAIADKPSMIRAIEKLAHDRVRLFQDMAMIKPPGGREKPWHQDHAYFNLPIDTRIVGVWIALDTVTPENGCMFLLAGAHKEGPRVHFMRRDWQICDDAMKGCHATCAPMEPGDVLLFDAKLPHGTPTNRSADYRWAIQLHYVPVGAGEVDERVRLDAFGNEGKNVTC